MNKRYAYSFAILVLASPVAGCSRYHGIFGVDRCADIPAGAIPEPAGNKVCAWQTAQITSAFADQTTLYQCDFVGETSDLSPQAQQRILRHIHTGVASQSVWMIEPSANAPLDQSRIRSVSEFLTEQGAPSFEVFLATPAAIGLEGAQAERVAGNVGRVSRTSPNGTGGIGRGGFYP